MTSSPWPEVTQDCSTAWDHLLINCVFTHKKCFIFVCPHTIFFSLLFLAFLHIFWEICGFKNGRSNLSTPTGRFMWWRGDKDCGNTIERPLGLLCAFLYACACACVRVCVIKCAWMCERVELHTSILYNTASAICHRGELTHELNRDKEQIYLKQLRYILWTTVKHSFLLNPKKMNLGYIYIYWVKPWRTPYFLITIIWI